jgi:hypothetical protein
MIESEKLLAAARAADMAAEAQTPQQELRAVMEVLQHREAMQIGLITAGMNRLSQTPRETERLPLREDGDDIGRIEARIPKNLFFHLMQQKNFGWDGFSSDEGMKDFLKTHPACRVKTVSGKITVGYGSQSARKPGVKFGRGTLNLAT